MTETAVVPAPGRVRVDRVTGWSLVVAGLEGALASVILTVEKISLLQQKLDFATGRTTTPPGTICDLSRWASCSGVMESDAASAFGMSNAILGAVGFSALLTLAVLLVAGVALPRWVWAGIQLGLTAAIVFVTWLQYESIFVIGLLCVNCVAVWIVTIPAFVLATRQSLVTWWPDAAVTRVVRDWTLLIVLLWYALVVAATVLEFIRSPLG